LRQSFETPEGSRDTFGLVLRLDRETATQLSTTPCDLSVHLVTFPAEIPGAPLLLFHFLWDLPSTRFLFWADPEAAEERLFLEALLENHEPLLLFLVGPAEAHATLFPCEGFLPTLTAAIACAGAAFDNPDSLRRRDPRLRYIVQRFGACTDALDWIRDVPLVPLAEIDPAVARRFADAPLTPHLRDLLHRPTRH